MVAAVKKEADPPGERGDGESRRERPPPGVGRDLKRGVSARGQDENPQEGPSRAWAPRADTRPVARAGEGQAHEAGDQVAAAPVAMWRVWPQKKSSEPKMQIVSRFQKLREPHRDRDDDVRGRGDRARWARPALLARCRRASAASRCSSARGQVNEDVVMAEEPEERRGYVVLAERDDGRGRRPSSGGSPLYQPHAGYTICHLSICSAAITLPAPPAPM